MEAVVARGAEAEVAVDGVAVGTAAAAADNGAALLVVPGAEAAVASVAGGSGVEAVVARDAVEEATVDGVAVVTAAAAADNGAALLVAPSAESGVASVCGCVVLDCGVVCASWLVLVVVACAESANCAARGSAAAWLISAGDGMFFHQHRTLARA